MQFFRSIDNYFYNEIPVWLMPVFIKTYLLVIFCLTVLTCAAQENSSQEKKLIQFSGIVVTGDSLNPVPYANVLIKGTRKGAISDNNGFFSFVAMTSDEIVFSALGYKSVTYNIPDTLNFSRYSWIQILNTDTIFFSETIIMPWTGTDQFKKNFVKTETPDNDQKRAEKNLNLAMMKEKYQNLPMDGKMNYRNYVDKQIAKSYYNGQYMPNNLLNPFAWAQFIKAWKEGKFKKTK